MNIALEPADITADVRGWITGLNPQFWAEISSVLLQVGARDEAGNLVGGALGDVRYGVLRVNYVGIAPTHRRQGLGTRLLAALEREGIKKGAVNAFTTTLEFEAPEFYQKQGYRVLSVMGTPLGSRVVYLGKELRKAGTSHVTP